MSRGLILIVEDNERNLKLARDVLATSGFRTLEAVRASDGIALALEHRPDLIVMDIQLPDMDGASALEQLRNDPRTASIPVVALTAFAMSGDERHFLESGFDGYLAKPIAVRDLVERVEHFAKRNLPSEGLRRPTILAVDDEPRNLRLFEAVLGPAGYAVVPASSGQEGLARIRADPPDVVLLDIFMPEMDGYDVCRLIRADPATRMLPVIMITAAGSEEKMRAIEAGADDFVVRPFNRTELLARVGSLVRIKEYHDTIRAQAAELAALNRDLEQRVRTQVDELERVGRLRRFLSPQLADVIVESGDERLLASHRREVAVLFTDLRGFTTFADTVEPEEVMAVLREYHRALGVLVERFQATVGFLAGDGLMVFFNDPIPCSDPAAQAVRMALALRETMRELTPSWGGRGYELDFGAGIALGYATLGQIGFEGRYDYGAIGTVTILASRLCAEAQPGQILVSQRTHAALEGAIDVERIPDLTLKGFFKPFTAYNALALNESALSVR